jgi:hypothetical protein
MKALFARTKTAAAVSALLAAVALPVHAVNIANDGLAEEHFTNYYTVRNGYTTNISIVNTSANFVVAVKIRFHEAANSRDARDFNLFLSPNDVWVGTVGLGPNNTPYIATTDKSCTAPAVLPVGTPFTAANRAKGFVINPATGVRQMDFTAAGYTGANQDADAKAFPTAQTIGRTTEGYIEVIEMGVALPLSDVNPKASQLAAYAVHGAGQNCSQLAAVYSGQIITLSGSQASVVSKLLMGDVTGNPDVDPVVPPSYCAQGVQNPDEADGVWYVPGDRAGGIDAFQAEFCEPLNVIKVASNLVRASTGVAMAVPVTAFANFYNPNPDDFGVEDQSAPYALDIMQEPSSLQPDASYANPPRSVQVSPTGLTIDALFIPPTPDTPAPPDAVSSLLMATSIINTYQAASAAPPATTWVVTFPTKAQYVDFATYKNSDTSPFTQAWDDFSGQSCDPVSLRYWNREEATVPGEVLPSPLPPDVGNALCHETQTVSFASNISLFGSQFNQFYTPLKSGYSAGWARLSLPTKTANTIVAVNGITFTGLPVTGFGLTVNANGAVNVGAATPHSFERSITTVPDVTGQ